MKIRNLFIVGAFAGLLTLTGCSTLDKLYTPTPTVTPAVTNSVPQVIPAATNAVTGVVLPSVTNELQIVTAPQTNIVIAPNPTVQAGIQAAAALPFPFAGVVAILGGWLYTAYANMRNKKLSAALVTGIDAGRQILQSTPEGQKLDAKFKDVLIQHQELAGVLNAASTLVNTLTGDTVKPATQ